MRRQAGFTLVELMVVIAIILQALWSLGQKAIKGWLTGIITALTPPDVSMGVRDTICSPSGKQMICESSSQPNCQRSKAKNSGALPSM